VFLTDYKKQSNTEQSWVFKMAAIDEETYDLSPKNPNTPEEAPLRSPELILEEMVSLDEETSSILESIKELI